jgi:hypothetical protein
VLLAKGLLKISPNLPGGGLVRSSRMTVNPDRAVVVGSVGRGSNTECNIRPMPTKAGS